MKHPSAKQHPGTSWYRRARRMTPYLASMEVSRSWLTQCGGRALVQRQSACTLALVVAGTAKTVQPCTKGADPSMIHCRYQHTTAQALRVSKSAALQLQKSGLRSCPQSPGRQKRGGAETIGYLLENSLNVCWRVSQLEAAILI